VRICQKLPLCLIMPVLAGPKMDPLLAKAEPISNGGSTSVITYLRRGRKKLWVRQQLEREESDNVKETALQTPRSLKKEGEEVPKMSEQSLPLQTVMKTKVRQAVALQSSEVHGRADIHLQPTEGTQHWGRWMDA